MNTRIVAAFLLATAITTPAFADASAQPGGLTRAQVRAELVQFEKAGYQAGGGEDTNYPAAIQAAEARVAQHGAAGGFGGVANGSSSAGASPAVSPTAKDGVQPIYVGG